MEEESAGEVFERGGWVAVYDDGLQVECLACYLREVFPVRPRNEERGRRGIVTYQLELLHQVVNGGWRSANQDMLPIDEAQQDGQL